MDNSIEIAKHFEILREELLRPSVKYQQILRISKDGNMYCILLGENLVDGIAGFGKTMYKAMNDFDTNFDN